MSKKPDCISNYMITDVITLNKNDDFEQAVDIFEKHKIRCVPVIDDAGVFCGTFSLHTVIKKISPLAAQSESAMSLNFFTTGIDFIRDKYQSIKDQKIDIFLDKEAPKIKADVHFMEVLNVLIHGGSPVSVVDPKTHKLLGIFTYQEAFKLMRAPKKR